MYNCYKTVNGQNFWSARFQSKAKAESWLSRQKEAVIVKNKPADIMRQYWGVAK